MSHPRRISPWIVALLLFLGAIGLSSALRPAYAKGKSRHEKLSKRQMKKMMNKWARELGVKCDHCHIKKGETFDFDKSTPNKTLAKYCDEKFVATLRTAKKGKAISCGTCHDGKVKFMPRPKKK
ncbi:MAG: hypothetical protein JKY65_22135 [Planctomycetes bacterium]|nr:hypothetical protein [Planctomycetota bacterium]